MEFYLLMATLTVHVLAGVFWAGSTSAMANLGSAEAIRLFPFQMGSAALTILAGLVLWYFQLGAQFHTHEQILLAGIAAAIIAAAIQGNIIGRARRARATTANAQTAIVDRVTTANRVAAGLLIVTVACMMIARFY
ncbi:MAG: hypothetical protein R3E44_07600 [Paracoccaceae bacterium]